MIFAKVDVELLTHPRILRIPRALRGECVGVWLMALLYSRRHELDGFCPLDAIDQVARDKVVDQLVSVGLVAREKQDGMHGIRILRYADRNETKEEIVARRSDTLKRVTAFRKKQHGNGVTSHVTQSVTPDVTGPQCNEFVPGSGSDSGSVSDLDLRPPRINPAAQSFQDNPRDPGSGVVRAADVLRTGENESRKPRKDPDSVAKAIEETKRFERAFGGKP